MKKLILPFLFLFLVNVTFAQNENQRTDIKKHEVKINGLLLAVSTSIDLSYEYVKNQSTGFGVSVLYNIRDKAFPISRFAVTPFYRVYFFSKKDYGANGLFVEGFVKMAMVKNKIYHDDDIYQNRSVYVEENEVEYKTGFNTAIGISIGKKWVNKADWSLEIFAGMGATISSPNSVEGLPRIGVNIGKRF